MPYSVGDSRIGDLFCPVLLVKSNGYTVFLKYNFNNGRASLGALPQHPIGRSPDRNIDRRLLWATHISIRFRV